MAEYVRTYMGESQKVVDGGHVRLVEADYAPDGSRVHRDTGGQGSGNGTDWVAFHADLSEIFECAQLLLEKKHRDYGPTNISAAPGGALNGLRVRMHDKLARANNLIDSGQAAEFESLEDTFMDLMNYSAIALMVLRGRWQ